MRRKSADDASRPAGASLLSRLQRRGVLRVALSYGVIAWLTLQIGDVVLEPLDAPGWVMRALIVVVVAGFPLALLLAWYFELTPAGIERDTLPADAPRPAVRGARRYSDVVVIGVLLVIVIVLLARQTGLLEPAPELPVIAVLPFSEIGVEDKSYFGDGLADTLIQKLGQLSGVVVLASSSSFEFRGPGLDLGEVARKLGAHSILEGTLQRAGGVLRVNTRLVDATSGQQQWTASFNRRTQDLFEVQDEIATSVTSALQLVLTPEESRRLTHRDTLSLSAFDAYQRARVALARRTEEGMTEALQFLFEAIEIDPDFALAHAALAEAYFFAAGYRPFDTPWTKVAGLAREAAEKALTLDPGLGEAYLAQSYVVRGDKEFSSNTAGVRDPAIGALLEKAIALSPSNAIAWKFYSEYATSDDERLARLQKAAQLDPRSGIILLNLGDVYEDLGQIDKARQWYSLSVGTEEPYFELALLTLVNGYRSEPNGLAMAARWGHITQRAHPRRLDGPWVSFCGVLLELGAWDELAAELAQTEPLAADDAGKGALFHDAQSARLARARSDLSAAAEYAKKFEGPFLKHYWRDRTQSLPPGLPTTVLDAIALDHLRAGRASEALRYYEVLYPNAAELDFGMHATQGVNARMLMAAARKQMGQRDQAMAELRRYLDEVKTLPLNGEQGAGFIPFAVHAFLGETDAAIAALQQAVDAGFTTAWWGLKDGAFDADYAAVLADPRYQRLYGEIEAGITAQREDFLRNPDLPLETLLQAGLAPGASP